jgi:hypothetical protein
VNASPEPFSNWTLSTVEDAFAVFLAWLAATHPIVTAVLVVALVIAAVLVIWRFFGLFRRLVAGTGERGSGEAVVGSRS